MRPVHRAALGSWAASRPQRWRIAWALRAASCCEAPWRTASFSSAPRHPHRSLRQAFTPATCSSHDLCVPLGLNERQQALPGSSKAIKQCVQRRDTALISRCSVQTWVVQQYMAGWAMHRLGLQSFDYCCMPAESCTGRRAHPVSDGEPCTRGSPTDEPLPGRLS